MCVAPLHLGVCLGILGVVQAVAWAGHWLYTIAVALTVPACEGVCVQGGHTHWIKEG